MRCRHVPLFLFTTILALAAAASAGATPLHPTTFVPVPGIPTEDVDVVTAFTTNPTYPEMAIWPVEGSLNFFNLAGGAPTPITSIGLIGANLTGVDFVTDGTWGAYQTLGRGYMYDMNGPGFLPTLLATTILPGPVPSRRDIDPFLIPDALAPSGVSAVYCGGNTLHCRAIPTGAVRWNVTLPTSFVEAVDPVYSPNGHIFAPTEGFMTVINPATGAILSTTPLSGPLVREVDVRLAGLPAAPGPSVAWLPILGSLWMFDDAPGSLGGPLAPAIPIPSPLIEGNDMEIDPSGTLGYLPTLAAIVQVNLPGLGLGSTYPVFGMTHQRNHDTVFTPPSVPGGKWAYAMQGFMLIGDNFLFAPPPAILPSPGLTVDGVDPAFSDTPPLGTVFSIATLAATNVYSATGVSLLASIPRSPAAGVLRTDVDHKPAPIAGNYILQPTIGGLLSMSGFGPNDWVVTTSTGIEVVDLGALAVTEWVPFGPEGAGMAFRGGDAQPTYMAGAGLLEPAWSIDNPDQDFLTKCYEYKYAVNRNPYLYATSSPVNIAPFYPHALPYGAWGPPPLVGFDLLNEVKLVQLTDGNVDVLDRHGNRIATIPLDQAIGGLQFDQDNKVCKVQCAGQKEAVIDLAPLSRGLPALVTYIPYPARHRWYPVLDRMNGWECLIERDGRTLAVYDHLKKILVQRFTLPATAIRAPQFDEQRKTMVVPLANRTIAFFNTHNYRIALPASQYLYYSPVLPSLVCADLVFDLYNHATVATLYDNRLAVISNATGALLYDSGVLPHRPVSPVQVDCYNKVAKAYYRNTTTLTYYDMRMNLYPLAIGGVPTVQFTPLAAQPYGMHAFYSRGVRDFMRIGPTTIRLNHLQNLGAPQNLTTPLPMTGQPQLDRVNGYALCAMQGPNLYYVNLFKQAQGLAGATQTIALPGSGDATDNIVFSTYTHHAMGSMSDGTFYVIDLLTGNLVNDPALLALPRPARPLLFANPYTGLIEPYDWSWSNPSYTLLLPPLRENPAGGISLILDNYSQQPRAACDYTPPETIPPHPVPTLPPPQPPGDDEGIFQFVMSDLEPGVDVLAYKPGSYDFAPTYGTADDDGVCQDISILGVDGETVCFILIDGAGNATPPHCQTMTTVDVPGGGGLSFARIGAHPARGRAQFRLTLPTGGAVSITLYDVAGRKVRTLLRGPLDAGPHTIDWDLRGDDGRARAGVFFARVRTPDGDRAERIVVLPGAD